MVELSLGILTVDLLGKVISGFNLKNYISFSNKGRMALLKIFIRRSTTGDAHHSITLFHDLQISLLCANNHKVNRPI